MDKKKIVHIVEAFGGGVFTFLVDLVNSTSDEYDITIIYARREQTPENFKDYFNKNIKFIESNYLKRDINIKDEIKAIKEIKNIINIEKPNIVHLHSSKAGIIGRLAIKNKKIKLLYNPHGFSFLMENTKKIKRITYWLIEKVATLKKCIIIGCSKGEYEEAKKLTKNSICINNGIYLEKIDKEIKRLENRKIDINKLKICTIGRINYQKNPKEFNQIATENINKEFTWIGDGNLKNELKGKNINITGWKTRKEVIKILNDNDIFILPSLWEGLPIALLEAMYMKKLCIVSNVIGNKDVIENSQNGFIAKSHNDYTQIMNELDIENIERITENAKQDVIEKYNMKNTIEEYKKIYKE